MRRLIAGAALLLAACDTSPPPEEQSGPPAIAPLEVTDRANGQTLRLRVGQELTITLGECADCAAKWTLAERPPILSETAKADLGSGAADGADGARHDEGGNTIVQYLFRAERAGAGRLVLTTGRAGAAGSTLTFPVEVR